MNIADSVKRAPKWAWWTVGGVAVGAGALKLYSNRAAPDSTATASDGSTVGDVESGSTQPATTGSSPPGVIVPPIITGGDGSIADVTGAIGGLMGGLISDLSGMLGTVVTGDQAVLAEVVGGQQQTNDAIVDLLAGAGQAPKPATMTPTIVFAPSPSPAAPPRPAPPPAPSVRGRYPTWDGHTLWWWQREQNAYRRGRGWRWPNAGGGGDRHDHYFRGRAPATGSTNNPHQ